MESKREVEHSRSWLVKRWSRFSFQVRPRFGGVRAFHFNRGYNLGDSNAIVHLAPVPGRSFLTTSVPAQQNYLQTNGASQAKPQTRYVAGPQKSLLYLLATRRSNAFATMFLFFFVLSIYGSTAQSLLQPVGQWREHLPYQNAIQVVTGNAQVYCATQYNVYSVDETNTITRYSKVTGLNDVGVSTIGWDEASKQLVIVYNNSNIDVLKDRIVRNIGDVQRSTVSGNKTINYVYCNGGRAYLCSGLGVIVASLDRYEILDTWQPGNIGNPVQVNGFVTFGQFHYAATNEGVKRAAVGAANLADYRNWLPLPNRNHGPAAMVCATATEAFVLQNDSIFTVGGSLVYADAQWPIISLSTAENKLLVCQRTVAGASRVLVLSTTGAIERVVQQSGIISLPRWATLQNNAVWVADFFGGLSKFNGGVNRFVPDGPPAVATGEMVVNNSTLYVAAGAVNEAWNYQFNRNGIYQFAQGDWTSTSPFNTPILDTVLDFITLTIDPRNNSLWAGSYGGGLVHFNEGNAITVYKQQTTLQPAIGDPTSYRVSGLAFDGDNNLWIANYGAAQNLQVRLANGQFKAFTIPFFHFENAISQVLVDDLNQVWMVSPRGNGLFVLNRGAAAENTNDDKWKYLRAGQGNGNLPDNTVYSMANDKDGFIWIGTARGIAVVQCPERLFEPGGCEAILPVAQQDRFAGFLFQNEEVRTIAVDPANRKWIGTRNGVWCISSSGDKVIYRFTENNSPLLSNDVKQIAIDRQSGEVYFSTFNGICSFRSTAAAPTETKQEVLVFPNPVPPGYNGSIVLRGAVNNAFFMALIRECFHSEHGTSALTNRI